MIPMLTLNIRGGARICVPDSVHHITPYVLLEQEDWFEDEIRFARRFLRPGMAAVDLGASFGIYTMAMAEAVGAQGKVWAFEPTPQTADFLQQTIDVNRAAQVHLSRSAVSDRQGEVQLCVEADSELNSIARPGESFGEMLSIPAHTLDQLSLEHGWRNVDLVKIDVEGHELEAVTGGTSFFTAASPLVIFEIKRRERSDIRTLAPFRAMGYQFFYFVPGLTLLAPFLADQPADMDQLILFACKPERALALAAEGLLAQPRDAAEAEPAKSAWANYLEDAPYARELAGRWPSRAGLFAPPGLKVFLEGLALFAQSRDAKLDGTLRFTLLQRAAERVWEAARMKDTLPRQLTAARLAWELGRKPAAVQLLRSVGERMAAERKSLLSEPFLCPSPRYEHRLTGAPVHEWLACAVGEQWEKLHAASSYFTGTQSLGVLEFMAKAPFRSPEMERRRQLIRLRAGTQPAPEPNPLLCERSEENLNPQFWCGAAAA